MKRIEILGMSCARCGQLAERTQRAVKELGIDAEVIKVQDIQTISNYGVLTIPALVINGVVKVEGKVPKLEEIKEWIK